MKEQLCKAVFTAIAEVDPTEWGASSYEELFSYCMDYAVVCQVKDFGETHHLYEELGSESMPELAEKLGYARLAIEKFIDLQRGI